MGSLENFPKNVAYSANDGATRFSRRSILRSEAMYGHGYQSPGGVGAVERFCEKLRMRQGMNILEIGSGLGGASFHFNRQYGATVVGLDMAKAMIELSTERAKEVGLTTVSFLEGDIRTATLEKESFDLAWSRDCILYVQEKDLVWKNVQSALKQGGQLFVTDFCKGKRSGSEAFNEHMDRCDFHLLDLDEYERSVKAAGFKQVRAEDITDQFIESLSEERTRMKEGRETFLKEFTQEDYDYLMSRWEMKIQFCREGELKWGQVIAEK